MNIELNNYEMQTVVGALFEDVRENIEEGLIATASTHLQTARKFIRLLAEERIESYTEIADYLEEQIKAQS